MTRGQYWFVNTIKTVAFLAIGLVFVHWFTAGADEIVAGPPDDIPGTTITHTSPAERVLRAHENECWGGDEKPLAELPGAAIVQFEDGNVRYIRNHDLVDAAFNEALGLEDSDVVDVIKLCV